MRRVLGLRAEPQGFHWAVVEGCQPTPVLRAHGHCKAPVSYDEPRTLAWCRDRLLHLVKEHVPEALAVRCPEHNSRGTTDSHRRRFRIEGVLLEVAGSAELPAQGVAFATIGKNLGIGRSDAKDSLEEREFRGVNWADVCKERREAILVAVSSLRE